MIAYDLDGVLINDSVFGVHSSVLHYLIQREECCYPLFYPSGDWCIITGRPKAPDEPYTLRWLRKYFVDNPPKHVFHDNTMIENGALYKASVINEHPGITMFIESSKKQTEIISTLLKRPIELVCFSEFLSHFFHDMKDLA